MKKIIFTITIVLMLVMSTVVAFAQDEITVTIDSNKVEFNSELGTPFIDQNYIKYEMDLSSIYSSMFSGMANNENLSTEDKESLSVLKDIKATMLMNIVNINQSKDFEIPKEALAAPETPAIGEESTVE